MNDAGTKTFGEAIRHRIALILLIVAAFGVAGLFAARLTTPTYQASSQVYVDVSASHQNNVNPGDSLLNSYWVQQATSTGVLQRASGNLGHGETQQTLQQSVNASVLKSTNIVQITASAWYPQQAANRANAVAQALVDQNRADAAKNATQQDQVLTNRLNQLQPQINATQNAVNSNPNSIGLQTQLNQLYQQYSDTQNQLQQLRLNTADQANQVRVNQQATAPVKPTSPSVPLYVAGALLVGLVVAVILALILERFDDRVLNSGQLGRAAGTSLVVGMPDSWQRGGSERNLYTLALAHLFARHPEATRILAVAVLPDQTATEAAEQLGAAAAGLGHRAQVMGAATSEVEEEEESHNGEMTAEAAGGYIAQTAPVPLLATRRIRPHSPELEKASQDVTIIATPSPMSSPAAVTAGRQADVAVLVVTARRTRLGQVRQAAEALRAAGLDVGGAILIPPRPSRLRTLLRTARGASA